MSFHSRHCVVENTVQSEVIYRILKIYLYSKLHLVTITHMMDSKSRDILLDNEYKVHMSIIPKLGLIIVNELEDFGENWMEVNIVQSSRSKSSFDIRTLAGDIKQQAACRYLIESLQKGLQTSDAHMPGQISLVYKFIINLSLRPEIFNSRPHMNSLAQALVNILEDFQQQSQ